MPFARWRERCASQNGGDHLGQCRSIELLGTGERQLVDQHERLGQLVLRQVARCRGPRSSSRVGIAVGIAGARPRPRRSHPSSDRAGRRCRSRRRPGGRRARTRPRAGTRCSRRGCTCRSDVPPTRCSPRRRVRPTTAPGHRCAGSPARRTCGGGLGVAQVGIHHGGGAQAEFADLRPVRRRRPSSVTMRISTPGRGRPTVWNISASGGVERGADARPHPTRSRSTGSSTRRPGAPWPRAPGRAATPRPGDHGLDRAQVQLVHQR